MLLVAKHNSSFQIFELRYCENIDMFSCVSPKLQDSRFSGPEFEEKKNLGESTPLKCLILELNPRLHYAISDTFENRFPY